jgi:triosephosphate isomerase
MTGVFRLLGFGGATSAAPNARSGIIESPRIACKPNTLERGLYGLSVCLYSGRNLVQEVKVKLVAGNWKMNGLQASAAVIGEVMEGLRKTPAAAEVLVCPPATLLAPFARQLDGSGIMLGGQCCHVAASGAHTGDISAEMIRDAGASHVIVGHSERRSDHGETSAHVAAQVRAALRAGLFPVICIGENEAAHERGLTRSVLAEQLAGSLPDDLAGFPIIIAYEPVWAIGTGKTAQTSDIVDTHGFIRAIVLGRFGNGTSLRILYGGSVKPSNATEILHAPGVDGVLVGGASLKAADFLAVIAGCDAQ